MPAADTYVEGATLIRRKGRRMGDQEISPLLGQTKTDFLRHLLIDIKSLEHMIENGMIEKRTNRIGAEQEFCLVHRDLRPAMTGPQVLCAIDEWSWHGGIWRSTLTRLMCKKVV